MFTIQDSYWEIKYIDRFSKDFDFHGLFRKFLKEKGTLAAAPLLLNQNWIVKNIYGRHMEL